MSTSAKILAVILIIAAVVAVGLGWHSHESKSPENSPTPGAAATTSPSSTAETHAVRVYFSKHPESDNDPSATFAVTRTTTSAGVGRFAISQLLARPSAAESQAGYFTPGITMSGPSSCGGQDFSLVINSTATLQFCRSTSLKGVVSDGQLNSEMTDTLKQFSGVTKVIILSQSGNCLFDESGQNLCKK